MDASLQGIKIVLLDLDGTIHLGGVPIPGALEFIQRCRVNDIATIFLSNNSSCSVKQYVEKLHGMGINAREEDVLLSTHDCIRWLQQRGWMKIHCFGTEGMRSMMEDAGFECTNDVVDCVVVGYHNELVYSELQQVAELLHNGVPLVATHPDIVCPSPTGGLPDVGSMLAMFEAATGIAPTMITGKPRPEMILERLKEEGIDPSNVAMIGDRIYTDIAMARAANVQSILVLSGEATRGDLENSTIQPTLIVDSVDVLLR